MEESVNEKQVHELLYQALETEQGGQQIYEAAISCVKNPDLKEEWQKYLEETKTHEQIVLEAMERLSLDPSKMTPGRAAVGQIGSALVKTMEKAKADADATGAELVASECVVLAETKDHQNWRLISRAGKEAKGELGKALREAAEQVEDQEDEHLYHTTGWSRELWIQSLGLPAVLPPPEEKKDVKTAIGAARAANAREELLAERQ
jgi:rubrerythrin